MEGKLKPQAFRIASWVMRLFLVPQLERMTSSSYMNTCPYTGMLTVDLFQLSFCCCNKNTNQNQPAEELFITEGGQSRNPSRSLEAETRKECYLLACLACFLKLPRTTFLEATLPIVGCPGPPPQSQNNEGNNPHGLPGALREKKNTKQTVN